ncbi:MAG: 1-deoxy-D-xylulose-5-phosphate reductoisomerase [Lentisphaerae bacterium]|nr:1-deoxy-D-xylulose-5-phosphate reductoisomerase [Lentisphaerota bacterium]
MSKGIVILGSTGSIGENALAVARHLGGAVRVVGLAAATRTARLAEQARECGCRWAFTACDDRRPALAETVPDGCTALADADDLCARVCDPEVDMVLCAVVGTAGLRPVLAAIAAGKDIALASKEILVMAGEIVMAAAARHGVRVLPVDSEHCAIFQCLDGAPPESVERLILTASGGPFRNQPDLDLARVTPTQALAHPTWRMGGKITIDSATLMNKGLEVIEARWLFGVRPEQIEVLIHPQSIVHSMVEFTDGSVLAQLGYPDMRLPIQYCLTYPARCPSLQRRLDVTQCLHLDFEPPQHERFPALTLARQALAAGGTAPAAYNAANEVAVECFLAGRLSFPGIWAVVAETLSGHPDHPHADLETILADDAAARRRAGAIAARLAQE